MRIRRPVAVAGLAVVVVAAAAAVAYALWGSNANTPLGVVTAGDLDLVLVGDPTWTETSPDVDPAHAVGMQTDGETAAHLATPGDRFTLTQQFRTVLEGDNLAARLTVSWEDGLPPVPVPLGQVAATYTVTSPEGQVVVGATSLGSAATIPGEPDNLTPAQVAAWGADPWTLTVTLEYSGTDVLALPDAAGTVGPGPMTELGAVVIELNQVRDGEGFDS